MCVVGGTNHITQTDILGLNSHDTWCIAIRIRKLITHREENGSLVTRCHTWWRIETFVCFGLKEWNVPWLTSRNLRLETKEEDWKADRAGEHVLRTRWGDTFHEKEEVKENPIACYPPRKKDWTPLLTPGRIKDIGEAGMPKRTMIPHNNRLHARIMMDLGRISKSVAAHKDSGSKTLTEIEGKLEWRQSNE
jgi:hypothetical protein